MKRFKEQLKTSLLVTSIMRINLPLEEVTWISDFPPKKQFGLWQDFLRKHTHSYGLKYVLWQSFLEFTNRRQIRGEYESPIIDSNASSISGKFFQKILEIGYDILLKENGDSEGMLNNKLG